MQNSTRIDATASKACHDQLHGYINNAYKNTACNSDASKMYNIIRPLVVRLYHSAELWHKLRSQGVRVCVANMIKAAADRTCGVVMQACRCLSIWVMACINAVYYYVVPLTRCIAHCAAILKRYQCCYKQVHARLTMLQCHGHTSLLYYIL